MSVLPVMANGGNLSAQTNTAGATPVSFASQPCTQLTIANNTGTTLEFATGGGAVYLPVFSGTYYTIYGLSNVSQVGIRRTDQGATQVTVTARWEGA